jgi:lipid II:glycine glycyltransferase (peptidoglycan interpeptide bridge formation enzyme)
MNQLSNVQATTWNSLIANLPGAHLLQTWEWGQLKAHIGWQPIPLTWSQTDVPSNECVAAALVLQRTIPVGGFAAKLNVLYIPKGPVLDWNNRHLRQRVLDDLNTLARRRGAIFIKLDPDVVLGTGIPGQPEATELSSGQEILNDLNSRGWRPSGEQIQFKHTVKIDLTLSEEQILARMKQKTRYNVRLAERKGVTVRPGTPADLDLLYQMYAATSIRDGFTIREADYYHNVWRSFMQPNPTGPSQPYAEPLIAEADGVPLAALIVFRFARQAWYLYGMSTEAQREKMPNYLLQWEAMRRAKNAGCTTYDLWGAPSIFNESDPLWGVFRFKEGLGGTVVRHIGAWDLPTQPIIYRLYTQILPRLLAMMRRRGQTRTRQSLAV